MCCVLTPPHKEDKKPDRNRKAYDAAVRCWGIR